MFSLERPSSLAERNHHVALQALSYDAIESCLPSMTVADILLHTTRELLDSNKEFLVDPIVGVR